MLKSTENNAETTDFDALSDVLSALRVSGSILLNEDYAPPWGIAIPNADKLRMALKAPKATHVIAFHLVKRGYIEIAPDNGEPLIIEAGEMAICFGGAAHRILQGTGGKTIAVEALLSGGKNPFQPEDGCKGRGASLMCGVFMMHNVTLNPLFAALPPLFHASALRPGSLHKLPEVLNWMSQETGQMTLGSAYVVDRLLELLCIEILRAHIENVASTKTGWLAGLKDPVVGKAIAMIHSRPGDSWTVKRLAQGVAMSPSRFAARFSAALGDSPMAYVTKWRMNVAGRLLDETQQGIGEIASDVGYDNVAAFARGFKRHLGVPPGAWRSRQY
ncbi:MAG: AraC family transcriptional regulator [Methylobacter sp.]|nr:MAG: AraC family transcriptional regulator [Methylobacter sp.]